MATDYDALATAAEQGRLRPKAVEAQAAREGVTVSDLVRRAAAEYLTAHAG